MHHPKKLASVMFVMTLFFVFSLQTFAAEKKVNINKASVQELAQLKGVGEKCAQRIVAHRDANGLFTAPEDLMKVKGVGEKTYEKNKDCITVE